MKCMGFRRMLKSCERNGGTIGTPCRCVAGHCPCGALGLVLAPLPCVLVFGFTIFATEGLGFNWLAHGLHIVMPHLRAQAEKNTLEGIIAALHGKVAELEACIRQVNEELEVSRALAEREVEAAGQSEAASKQAISQLNTKLEQERAEVCPVLVRWASWSSQVMHEYADASTVWTLAPQR